MGEERRGEKRESFPPRRRRGDDDVYKCRINTKRFLPSSLHAHDFRLTSSVSKKKKTSLNTSIKSNLSLTKSITKSSIVEIIIKWSLEFTLLMVWDRAFFSCLDSAAQFNGVNTSKSSWLLPKTQNLQSHHNNNRINSSRITILFMNKTWRLLCVSLSLSSHHFTNVSFSVRILMCVFPLLLWIIYRVTRAAFHSLETQTRVPVVVATR